MRAASLLLPLLCLAGAVAACASPPDETAPAADSADITAATKESTGLYHWSEGGEVFPLFALRALEVDLNGKTVPFMSDENLASFGLIPDPVSDKNPLGMPVGFTVARAADTGLISTGINCAACHVGELTYQAGGTTTRMRIDGMPSHFDAEGYKMALLDALAANIGNKASAVTKARYLARATAEAARTSVEFEDFDGKADTAVARLQMLWTVVESYAMGESDVKKVVDGFDLPESRKQLLMARWYALAVPVDPNTTITGPNRTDAFASGSNSLFNVFGFHSTPKSPMRNQPLFEMEGKAWYDYTGNTNSINQRNVIQAMAVGGITAMAGDDATYDTSVNFPNLQNLEHAVYQIKTPQWPSALPYDATLAARGKDIYQNTCAGCHTPTMLDKGMYDVKIIPLAQLGTDDHVIQQYLLPITTPFATGNLGVQGNKAISVIQQKYCDDAKLTPQQCLALDDAYDAQVNPTGRRIKPGFATDAVGYQADILDGSWAYGTYLHNGSVPSIADLLEPASKRPTKFATGHVVYDAKRLGYVLFDSLSDEAKQAGAKSMIDTTLPGNSNAGHEGDEYGTNLPADDKLALLEYLKKHVSLKR